MTARDDAQLRKPVTTVVIGGVTFKLVEYTEPCCDLGLPYIVSGLWRRHLGVRDKDIYEECMFWHFLQCDLFNTDEDTT